MWKRMGRGELELGCIFKRHSQFCRACWGRDNPMKMFEIEMKGPGPSNSRMTITDCELHSGKGIKE
jgi:hypothetical protein